MTGHNAFVRINENRQLVGEGRLVDASVYTSDVPEVEYEDFWVSPEMVLFTGVEPPKESYRLVVRMSPGTGNGISSGWYKTVIVSPGKQDNWGESNITKLYTNTIGYAPNVGEKVFIELYWLDSENGFVGETMRVSAIAKETSQVEDETYAPRNQVTPDNLSGYASDDTINSFNVQETDGMPVVTAEADITLGGYVAGISGNLQGLPETYVAGRCYFPARGKSNSEYGISLMEHYTYLRNSYGTFQVAKRYGKYDPDFEMFGTTCMVNN